MMTRRMHSVGLAILVAAFSFTGTGYSAGADAADAVQKKDITALRALLKQRADVNATQPDGTTALHWAAHWNDAEAVKLLLAAGAYAKATNRYGASPLSEAVVSGTASMVEALLNAGADPKSIATESGETV